MKVLNINRKVTDEAFAGATGGVQGTLDGAAGGTSTQQKKKVYCPKCDTDRYFILSSGGRAHCEICSHEIFL